MEHFSQVPQSPGTFELNGILDKLKGTLTELKGTLKCTRYRFHSQGQMHSMLYPKSFLDSARQCAHQIKYIYTQSSPSLEFSSCLGVGHVIQTKVDMHVIK